MNVCYNICIDRLHFIPHQPLKYQCLLKMIIVFSQVVDFIQVKVGKDQALLFPDALEDLQRMADIALGQAVFRKGVA